MKKAYQKPQSEVINVAYAKSLLDETSTIPVPGGGHGTPDDSRMLNSIWDDEGHGTSNASRKSKSIWDDEE